MVFLRYSALFLLLLLQVYGAAGKKIKRVPPKVILVQLASEKSRFDALTKANDLKGLEVLQKDTKRVMECMISDFTDNFDYCPVYYYSDTNFDAIMAKNFNGILLNADLSIANNVSIPDTSFFIVCYGIPGWQSRSKKFEETSINYMAGKPNGQGLIVNNHEMSQIAYTVWIDFFGVDKRITSRSVKKYIYVSKKFNIEYFPLAGRLNNSLKKFKTHKLSQEQSDE